MAEEMTFADDPVAEIYQNDFDERMGQLQDASDSATLDGTEQRDDAPRTDDGDTSGTPRRGAGLQEIEAYLKETGQDHLAESVKKIFATNTRLQNEVKQTERSLDDRVRDAVSQAMRDVNAEEAGIDPDDPMAMVTPEQKTLFRRLLEDQARELGYVKNDDLTQREQKTWMAQADQDAAEQFGEAFGSVDDLGQVVLSDEARERMMPVYERIRDKARGWAYSDIYKLATFDEQIRAAEERGRMGKTQTTQERVQRVQRAQTERPGVPVTSRINIRGERGTPSDRSDKVMARALALAKRQLNH